MVSGNDSAFCIADAMTGEIFTWNGYGATCPLFSALMNARAAEIGMTQTNFVAPSGRFGTSTAWDMSLLGRTAMQNPVFREIVSDTTELILYEHGSGADASRMCSYGWLLGLQQQDPRIIGVKPGGSDEAGRTCVVAGVPEDQPEKLAFGVGLGWFEPYNSESKRARVEIMQVGLNLCEPPPLVASSAALGDFSWALQRAGEPSTAQGTFEVTSDGARALPVDIHLVKPQATAASPRLEVKLLHELLFDLPDGRSTTFSMTGLPGHRGFTVRNTGGTPAPIIITSGGQTRLTLAPGQAHSIPPAAGPVSIRLQADGARCELTLAGVCDITPSWLQTTYAPATSVRMELPDLAVQHGWKIIACSLENLPQPFPLRVIVDEPDNLLTFPRVPDLDGLTLTPTGPTERLAFDFHGIPGLEPANGYDILGGGTLDGTWAPLARIAPAPDGRAAYHTTLSLPAASRRFLKIAPAP